MCNCIHCRREEEATRAEFTRGYRAAKADTNWLAENPNKGSVDDCVCPLKKSWIFHEGYERGFADSRLELARYDSSKRMEEMRENMLCREKKRIEEMHEKMELEKEEKERIRNDEIFKKIFG